MNSERLKLAIFTDLDGTLLSEDSYDPGPAMDALKICRNCGIPVVFVSSKTRAEIEALRKELGNADPFVSENGGGIYLPRGPWPRPDGYDESGDYWALALGTPHPVLCRALHRAAETCGVTVEAFTAMTLDRVIELTGLSEEKVRLAQKREFDEPFIILNPKEETLFCLETKVQNGGMELTRGSRFHHIVGGSDKGRAVREIMALYGKGAPKIECAAVGDAANDLPMLQAADRSFLVRKPGGDYERSAFFDGVTITQGIGPEGFYEAVRLMTANT